MRTQRTKPAHAARRALTAIAGFAALTGIMLASSPAAAASTVLPEQPKKSCDTAVHGAAGDTVAITGDSVADVVNAGADKAKKILVLSEVSIWDDHLSRVVADADTIKVGTVPDAGESSVSGKDIAAEVTKLIEGEPGLGIHPDKTLSIISETVAETCGLTVYPNKDNSPSTAAAPAQPSSPSGGTDATGGNAEAPDPGDGQAVAGTPPYQGTGGARAPRDYSGVPAVPAPSAHLSVPPGLRYPPDASLPQQPPSFDILDAARDVPGNDRPEVREAGNADVLAAPAEHNPLRLPMLLAVVSLAMVTAALVRTWVMRRIST